MLGADWGVGEFLWSLIWFTLFFIWIWLLITVSPTSSAATTWAGSLRPSG